MHLSKLPVFAKIIATVIVSLFFSFITYIVWSVCGRLNSMFFYRETLVILACAFLLLNIHIDYKWLYGFIFKHRYVLGFVLFVVLVAAKINLSSIGMYDAYIQPGSGSEFVEPIFGRSQPIRSDEWAVSTPRALTYQYCAGEKYNDIIMATQTPNLQASGIMLSPAMLAKPFYLGYLFLPIEYAVSFQWCSLFIVTLLASIELFNILSNKTPLFAVMGGVMVAFSSFCMWWSGCAVLTYGMAAVCGIYHFLNADNYKKRIISGVIIAVFGASFVCTLYPAWLVPLGYIFLAIIVWSFVKNIDNIKKFKKLDWILFAVTVVLAIGIIATYYYNQIEYATAVSNTVYPGSRRSSGGYALNEILYYPASFAFPFVPANGSYPFSEYGTFFSLFPIPMLLSFYLLFKTKKKDLLSILLLVISSVFILYCTVGLPKIFATITLMSFSTAARTAPMLGLVQILLLVRSMYLMKENNLQISKRIIIPVAFVYSTFVVLWCDKILPFKNYMSSAYMVMMCAFIFFVIVCCIGRFNEFLQKAAVIGLIAVICVTALFVLPIRKGLDAIYSKPAAKKVMSIVEKDPDAKWLSLDQWVENGFYVACGAKVINSNNYIPNYELWNTLFTDEEYKQYDEVYNRYCHLIVSFTTKSTQPILNQEDLVTLNLNYSQLKDIDVKYIVAKREVVIPKEYDIDIEQLYSENGAYIYRVEY